MSTWSVLVNAGVCLISICVGQHADRLIVQGAHETTTDTHTGTTYAHTPRQQHAHTDTHTGTTHAHTDTHTGTTHAHTDTHTDNTRTHTHTHTHTHTGDGDGMRHGHQDTEVGVLRVQRFGALREEKTEKKGGTVCRLVCLC